MSILRRVATMFLAVVLAGCAVDDRPPAAPASDAARASRVESRPPRDLRLRADVAGFDPPAEMIDLASSLGDPNRIAAALSEIDASPPYRRVTALRAGLRLVDDAAARACAARLTWKQLDRWECARCVDLLMADALKPGNAALFEEFRSYLGSVELPRFLRSLPSRPWHSAPDPAIGALHRIAKGSHLPAYIEVTRNPDDDIAGAAWTDVSLLGAWNDDFREEVARREVEGLGRTIPDSDPTAPGLPPVLAAWLRAQFIDPGLEVMNDSTWQVWNEKVHWCWECTPGPRDAELLMAFTERGPTKWDCVAGIALTLLGKLHDPTTEAFLRRKADDDEQLARWALARRGDAAMIERLGADVLKGEHFAIAELMEVDPARARRLIEERLLGQSDDDAKGMLWELGQFARPGAYLEPLGFDWRRTSLEGLDRAAVASDVSGERLALVGIRVPGCRTREVAEAAARKLRPSDFGDSNWEHFRQEWAAFLETAAPESFRAALRRIVEAGGEGHELALRWLVALGDVEAAATFVAHESVREDDLLDLARTRAPEVRQYLEEKIHGALSPPDDPYLRPLGFDSSLPDWVAALAVLHGLPSDAAGAFDGELPLSAIDDVLAARPIDAIAAILEAAPNEEHGSVGAVDDARVRAYLTRLRERRDLDLYWYATGQLAVLGDPSARADFWGAMEDGRYRIVDHARAFERTLGWDLSRTMPFWIDELRSQCCRIVTNHAGDIVQKVFGDEFDCFDTSGRTPYRRAKELWDAARGRFVRSRIAGHWVPAPR